MDGTDPHPVSAVANAAPPGAHGSPSPAPPPGRNGRRARSLAPGSAATVARQESHPPSTGASERDEGAPLGEALATHRRQLSALAGRILGCPDHAEDAVQEALIALWQQDQAPAQTRAWLVRATLHRSLHARRGAERRRKWEERAGAEWVEHCPLCDPEREALEREGRTRLIEALDELGEDQRRVVELRAVAGLAYQEIAETLGVPVGTVRSRLNRARAAVEAGLARYDAGSDAGPDAGSDSESDAGSGAGSGEKRPDSWYALNTRNSGAASGSSPVEGACTQRAREGRPRRRRGSTHSPRRFER